MSDIGFTRILSEGLGHSPSMSRPRTKGSKASALPIEYKQNCSVQLCAVGNFLEEDVMASIPVVAFTPRWLHHSKRYPLRFRNQKTLPPPRPCVRNLGSSFILLRGSLQRGSEKPRRLSHARGMTYDSNPEDCTSIRVGSVCLHTSFCDKESVEQCRPRHR